MRCLQNKEDVKETLWNSNLSAAPGTDGNTGLFYKVCWEAMGDALTQVVGEKLPASMRTAMMVFGTKPKKAMSLQPKDKRRFSLLNFDFKLLEGLDARKFRKVNSRVLSNLQYVAGDNRNIHHGICRARDAIHAVSKSKSGCGIADTDFVATFDWLVLNWVWKILRKIGVSEAVVRRVQNLYSDSITIVVVNNTLGRVFLDRRGSLRQGGCASIERFAMGIDPLLRYLEKRLTGIPISSPCNWSLLAR
jgi:hypothetical protein